ncbi:MAG TPA: HAD family hydrolase [Candidatus Gracilibacteria bacterium]|nr:HAD family hydrolase [Candidatus Gracilibacteria bacterium]
MNGEIPDWALIEAMRMKEMEKKKKRQSREGLNWDKVAHTLSLPFRPSHTETLLHVERFEDLEVADIVNGVRGLALDVDGTMVPHHTEDFSPAVIDKLRELQASKLRLCVFSNNTNERRLFDRLKIPVVDRVPAKPHPGGFLVAAQRYLDLAPEKCAMVGDNPLTDGGCRRIGMRLILVDPIPGKEGFFHRASRGYARGVKQIHDFFRG